MLGNLVAAVGSKMAAAELVGGCWRLKRAAHYTPTRALSGARLTPELASRNPGARTLPPASADLESRSVFYRHFNPSSPK